MITGRVRRTTAAISGHYDTLDAFHKDVWGMDVHHGLWEADVTDPKVASVRLTDMVIDKAEIAEGSQVVDIGCGYGETARRIVERKKAKVTAMTVSESQHRVAQSLTPPGCQPEVLLQDWLENELPDNFADTIVSIECLIHIPDKAEFFRQVRRVLKPGGRAVITAWLASDSPARWQRALLLEAIVHEMFGHSMGSAREYLELAGQAGLRPLEAGDRAEDVQKTWLTYMKMAMVHLAKNPDRAKLAIEGLRAKNAYPLSQLKVWAAYRVGAMRYGVFVLT